MIDDPQGEIKEILSSGGVSSEAVAELIRAETPTDMYHSVVSSSFDADRLDYLIRDRYMTGTGAGAIDLDWLMDNVRVAELDISLPDSEDATPIYSHGFCLGYKARDAAEDFLLARYRLYTNVYFHKTTRGIEQLVAAFFRFLAREVATNTTAAGLADANPLVQFFLPGGETISNYRALDDSVVWNAFHAVAASGSGQAKVIAKRILDRQKPICLDIQQCFPEDAESQRRLKHALNEKFKDNFDESVFRDSAKLSIYGEIGADDGRAQKRLMIQMSDRRLKEITHFTDATIAATGGQRSFERYFFLNDSEYKIAEGIIDSVKRRRA